MVFEPEFWREEYIKYLEAINPNLLKVFMAGAKGGVALLPPGYGVLMNWEYFNERAIQFLYDYGVNWGYGIAKTTEGQVTKIIDQWIRSGEKFPNLVKKMEMLPFSKARAEMIAVTEVTRAFAEGNIIAWKSVGFVTEKRWMTAQDDLVCPICAPLHNTVVEIDTEGFTTEIPVSGELISIGLYAPPAHIRCRCWLQPVVSEVLLEEIIARTP